MTSLARFALPLFALALASSSGAAAAGLGQDMVRADVESYPAPLPRWKRFEQIISQPTLPSDLRAR